MKLTTVQREQAEAMTPTQRGILRELRDGGPVMRMCIRQPTLFAMYERGWVAFRLAGQVGISALGRRALEVAEEER